MKEKTMEMLYQHKFVAIARRVPLDVIVDVAKAAYQGGVCLMEITFDQSAADPIGNTKAAIQRVVNELGDKMWIGAGTVLTVEQVQAAAEAGAKYIISPNTNKAVIQETKKLGLVPIPGAMTPSEITDAWDLGAEIIKLFPADDLGYHYIKNILAPLSHISLMATGGVNPDTIPKFFEAGCKMLGAGITIFKPELIKARDYEGIKKLARAHMDAVKRAAVEFCS